MSSENHRPDAAPAAASISCRDHPLNADHATFAQYRRSLQVRFSRGIKLCANSIHIALVSGVGQSGWVPHAATTSELSQSLSSWPVWKVVPVSVTALIAANLELNPAWIRMEAERFIRPGFDGGDGQAELMVFEGEIKDTDRIAVGCRTNAYGLHRPWKTIDEAALNELQGVRFRTCCDSGKRLAE
jgi:hypothetical protein